MVAQYLFTISDRSSSFSTRNDTPLVIYSYQTSIHPTNISSSTLPSAHAPHTSFTFQFHIILSHSPSTATATAAHSSVSHPPPFLTSTDLQILQSALSSTLQVSEFLFQFQSFKQEIQTVTKMMNFSPPPLPPPASHPPLPDPYDQLQETTLSHFSHLCANSLIAQTQQQQHGRMEYLDGCAYRFNQRQMEATLIRPHQSLFTHTNRATRNQYSLPNFPGNFRFHSSEDSHLFHDSSDESQGRCPLHLYSQNYFQLFLSNPEMYPLSLEKLPPPNGTEMGRHQGQEEERLESGIYLLIIPFLSSERSGFSHLVLMRIKWNSETWISFTSSSDASILLPSTLSHLAFLTRITRNFLRMICWLQDHQRSHQLVTEQQQQSVTQSFSHQLTDLSLLLDEVTETLTQMVPTQQLQTYHLYTQQLHTRVDRHDPDASVSLHSEGFFPPFPSNRHHHARAGRHASDPPLMKSKFHFVLQVLISSPSRIFFPHPTALVDSLSPHSNPSKGSRG
jgi:hypothetical protein